MNNLILETDRQFWELRKKIDLSLDFLPINLAAEKQRFIDSYKAGKVYNPVFEYNKTENLEFIKPLEAYYDRFNQFKEWPLRELYLITINELIEHIHRFDNRNDPEFSIWLTGLYDKPKKDEIVLAKQYLQTQTKNSVEDELIKPEVAKEILHAALDLIGINHWKVEVTEMVAKMAVNMKKTLKINKASTFTLTELNRLIAHEIETHIYRHENGLQQIHQIFAYGLPDYITVEEGIAISNEEKRGLLDIKDMNKYALRFVLADRCALNDTFYELFEYCMPYLDNEIEQAFTMVTRLKRGLTDTLSGGYIKDTVYFRGWKNVRSFSQLKIEKLYIGKIGDQHLDLCESMGKDLIAPRYLPKDYKVTLS